jgi:ATP-dependent DNA ligase
MAAAATLILQKIFVNKGSCFLKRTVLVGEAERLEMKLNTIYKRDTSGSIRIWYAELGEGPLKGHWRTVSGLLDGEKLVTEWKYAEPKRQANSEQQAVFEATAAMTKRLKVDYRTTIGDVDEQRHSVVKPMLAKTYAGWQGECFSQPKLDGMRCIATKDGLWSRLNNRIISVPHIEADLKSFFGKFPTFILDGELYNHDLSDDFNSIMSLTKKTTRITMEDLERSKRLIQYWLFDVFDPEYPLYRFKKRWDFLNGLVGRPKSIVLTPTKFIQTEEMLNIDFINLLQEGYEGQIIRFDKPYEQKRSYNLLKRKEYIDQEFELIDILEGQGNWQGYAKIAKCVTIDGEEFSAGISGTQEFNARLLKEKDKYHSVTVKYFQLTPGGSPRFPIAIKFHEEFFDDLLERIKPQKDLFK